MKKWIIAIVGLAVVGAVAWWGYGQYTAEQEAELVAAQDAEAIDELENVIWASGKLEPLTWAELKPVNQGQVTAILVDEGDWVQAGDVLIELDTGILQSQVEVAEATLAEANAALDKLLVGATDAEIAAADAAVASAQAGIAQAAGQMLETQASIDTADAQVESAKRQYSELASHPTDAERQVARAEVAVADAGIKQAQAAFNLVRGDPQIGALPQSRALNEATAAAEVARAGLALTEQGATPQQLGVAASAITVAEAQVSAAESRGPGAEANVQAAIAMRDSAQAALDKLLQGASAEDIAMAEAHVAAAEASLHSAQAALRQSQIVAPFDGQVGEINVRPGELTSAETTALLFGDPSQMEVRTTDLRETDVVNVDIGMPVEVTFDALPDIIFDGTITQIAPVSNTDKGSTNYTIRIQVDDLDERLRWGMTAFVNIQIDR